MIRLLGAVWHITALAVLGSYFIVLIRNLRAIRRLEDEPPASDPHPKVSVLIPARNEAENLGPCLDSLLRQDYPEFDVTVLDDQSEDATREVVQSYLATDERVRLLDGKPMPEGWLGKPWACQQLGDHADGDILLFVDADTWFEPDALSRTGGLMQREKPGLLSVLAHQVTGTFAERLVLPGLYMVFLCTIPFWKLENSAYPHIAAANGQFMCFDRDVYHSLGGHGAVRNEIIEDLAFAGVIKRSGHRLIARSGVELVHCRMYQSWREVLDGFSKNAYSAIGEDPRGAAVFVLMTLGAQVLPATATIASVVRRQRTVGRLWLPLSETILLILTRYLLASRMRFRRRDALFAPLTGVAGVVIMLRSIWWRHRTGYEWKGRRLP